MTLFSLSMTILKLAVYPTLYASPPLSEEEGIYPSEEDYILPALDSNL